MQKIPFERRDVHGLLIAYVGVFAMTTAMIISAVQGTCFR